MGKIRTFHRCRHEVDAARPLLSNADEMAVCLEYRLPVRCQVEANDVGAGFLQLNRDGGDLVTSDQNLCGVGAIVERRDNLFSFLILVSGSDV